MKNLVLIIFAVINLSAWGFFVLESTTKKKVAMVAKATHKSSSNEITITMHK